MRPDLDTLREMWRYHLGRAYWRAHPLRTLGIYDEPRHRILQYSVYGVTNLLLPATALALAHDIYEDEKFQALASASRIAQVLDGILYILLVTGLAMTITALRLFQVHCCNGDTDRCDPFRCWAMFRAYRWAKSRGWIHQVEGRLIFDRRLDDQGSPPPGSAERRVEGTSPYPAERPRARPIAPSERR